MQSKHFFVLFILFLAACSSSDDNETEQVVEQLNTAPVVSVNDYSGEANATINIESDAQDSDGSIVSYSWTQTNGPQAIITDNDGSASITLPAVTEVTELTFSLTVTDDDGASTTASFTVMVAPLNVAPVVTVQDQEGEEHTVISITAEATDADGTIAEYVWTQTSGVAATFESDSITLNLTLPEVTETSDLTFELSVTDDDGETTTTSFLVTVENVIADFVLSGSVSNLSKVFVDTQVAFEIGDLSFETTTNELGQYSVELTIPRSHQDQLIKISSTPVETPLNQYVSIIPSIQELKDELQDSNVIDADINTGMDLNSFNTAEYVLADIAATSPFDSYDSFSASSQNWTPSTFFELSVIFEIVSNSDFIEQHYVRMQRELPTDNANLLTILNEDFDIARIWEMVRNLDWNNYKSVESLVVDNLPSVVYESGLDPKVLMQPFGELSFNEDGTGSLSYQYVTNVDFTWTESNNVTTLEFPDALLGHNGKSPYNLYSTGFYVTSMTFSPVYKNQLGYYVEITQTVTNRNGDVIPEVSYANLLPLQTLVSIDELLTQGESWNLDFDEGASFAVLDEQERGSFGTDLKEITFTPDPQDSTRYDMSITKLTLEEDNQAEKTTFETQATFSDGVIQFEYDSVSYQISVAQTDNAGSYVASIHSLRQGEDSYDYWREGELTLAKAKYELSESDLSGKILTFPVYFLERQENYWQELNEDGTMATIYTWDDNDDGIISPNYENGDVFVVHTGLWKVEGGKLHTLRHRGNGFDYSFENINICLGGAWTAELSDRCRARNYVEREIFDFVDNESLYYKFMSTGFYDDMIDTSVYPDAQAFTPDFYSTGIVGKVLLSDERPIAIPTNEYDESRNQ